MKELIEQAIQSINTVADANTVIGQPLTLPNGVTVVPYSKVSVGLATGGADRAPKNQPAGAPAVPLFAGGNGAGVSVTPLGFLVIAADGTVTLLDLKNPESFGAPPASNPVDKVMDGAQSLMDRAPELLARCKAVFAKKPQAETEPSAEENGKEA